jgi:WD40 repeat protein
MRVWDVAAGIAVRVVRWGTWCQEIAWSPDGKTIVVGDTASSIVLFDALSGDTLRTLPPHKASINGAAWAPDSARLATAAEDGTLRIWDARSGKVVHELSADRGDCCRITWSPDGKQIACNIRIWEAESGRVVHHLPAVFLSDIRWSRRGDLVATSDLEKDYLGLWDAATGRPLQLEDAREIMPIVALAWSDDSTTLAAIGKACATSGST